MGPVDFSLDSTNLYEKYKNKGILKMSLIDLSNIILGDKESFMSIFDDISTSKDKIKNFFKANIPDNITTKIIKYFKR